MVPKELRSDRQARLDMMRVRLDVAGAQRKRIWRQILEVLGKERSKVVVVTQSSKKGCIEMVKTSLRIVAA